MAQAMVSIPQQVVHVHHAIPRVRPPRMLKGSISPNTLPQPEGKPPSGKVWVQGRWRVPTSNSAKDKRKVQSAHVEKAVVRDSHGHNIYAYTHIRTNQVVYSLTRILRVRVKSSPVSPLHQLAAISPCPSCRLFISHWLTVICYRTPKP